MAGVRQYSLERIQKELEFFERKKVKKIFVLDLTFNFDMKRAKKILHMILKTASLIHFTFEIRTDDPYNVIQFPNQSAIFDLEIL